MEQTELVYFFVRELLGLGHFYKSQLPGLIAYAKRYKFSEQYTDEDFKVSVEVALEKVKGVRT